MKGFKIGDRVKIVTKEPYHGFGEAKVGDIGVVTSINIHDPKKLYIDFPNHKCWTAFEDEIVLCEDNQSIHITVKGRTTHAVLKQGNQVIKTAKATCNPSDEFNFEVGAKIAFQRLVGTDGFQPHTVIFDEMYGVKEVERRAEVGEYVRIINERCSPTMSKQYKNGSILKIIGIQSYDYPKYGTESCEWLFNNEYVVLENYHPQEEPKIDFTKVSGVDLLAEVQRRLELSDHA